MPTPRDPEFQAIDAAFRAGDLAALRSAVGDPAGVPNGKMPRAVGSCLEYAIYHSPLPFIRALLELGADPAPKDHDGFPPLIAALSCSRAVAGGPRRPDVGEILSLLLAFGADPNQRGVNDYTALHMAVGMEDLAAVRLLLDAGADPRVRTRIDEWETPREMADRAGLGDIARVLAEHEALRGSGG
jgi:ankyrin repeat protein